MLSNESIILFVFISLGLGPFDVKPFSKSETFGAHSNFSVHVSVYIDLTL